MHACLLSTLYRRQNIPSAARARLAVTKAFSSKSRLRQAPISSKLGTSSIPSLNRSPCPESNTYDVVVVGGGIAGLSAASRAAELGLRVALLERGTGEQYLNNTRYSGGILHVAFRNVKARPDELLEAIQQATHGNADPAIARAIAETSGRAVDWLSKEGVKFLRMSQIEWQQWVMAPPRRIMPGLDWEGRGPDFTLRTLAKNVANRGGAIFRGTAAAALMKRNGVCAKGGGRGQATATAAGSSPRPRSCWPTEVSRAISISWAGTFVRTPRSSSSAALRPASGTGCAWHRPSGHGSRTSTTSMATCSRAMHSRIPKHGPIRSSTSSAWAGSWWPATAGGSRTKAAAASTSRMRSRSCPIRSPPGRSSTRQSGKGRAAMRGFPRTRTW
ncbi:MAG: FAD-dependent oxidoreductase [Betaproteobacteria bacterium]|nr:FAD-dependent oxidoreductase [Betaproteobacteria bacterium]